MKDTGVLRLSQRVRCPAPDLSYLFPVLREAQLVPRYIQTAGVLSWYLWDPGTRVQSPPVTCGLREPLGVAWNEIGPGGLWHRHHHHISPSTLGRVWNNTNSNNSQAGCWLGWHSPSSFPCLAQNQTLQKHRERMRENTDFIRTQMSNL